MNNEFYKNVSRILTKKAAETTCRIDLRIIQIWPKLKINGCNLIQKSKTSKPLFVSTDYVDQSLTIEFKIGAYVRKNYNFCVYTKVIYTRRPVPSTDQAIPRCFYFRISWILMEQCVFIFFVPSGFWRASEALNIDCFEN